MCRFRAVRHALKAIAPVAVAAIGLAVATPGQAGQVFLQSSSMNTLRVGTINGPLVNEAAYMAPIKFTAFEGTGATPQTGATSGPFELLAFCVDIFHNIGLGTLNLKYDDSYDLTTNSEYLTASPFQGGANLSGAQINQVARLVNYGALVYRNGPATADTLDRLSGLQGAIWEVVNPGYTVTGGTAAVNNYINAYADADYRAALTGYGHVSSKINFISESGKYGTSFAHQSFAFAAAPEPGTWALLICGFGLTGAALRRSRRQLVAVKA